MSSRSDKIDYLNRYKNYYYRHKFIEEHITSPKGIMVGDNKTSNGKSINEYIDEKSELEEKMLIIKSIINSVKNDQYKTILKYRYLEFYSLKEASDFMYLSYSLAKKIHRKALDCIVM